jgi:Glycosyl transferase family 90
MRVKNQSIRFTVLLLQIALFTLVRSDTTVFRHFNSANELNDSESLSSNSLPLGGQAFSNAVANRIDNKTPTSIRAYLQSITDGRQNMVLLKWNSSGVLVNSSTRMLESHFSWIDEYLVGDFQYTSPSEYGKVAMIWVCDVMSLVPWDNTPPVPVIVYTMDKERLGSQNYILGPDPYDEGGYSEWQVNLILNKFTDTMINTTFDTFNQRNNTLIWRGGNHGEEARKALVALAIAEEEQMLGNATQYLSNDVTEPGPVTSTNLWLDAKFSGGNDLSVMTEEYQASHYKYHLDVGGVSGTSWEGLRWKMCSGNLVFRIESSAIDWWHVHLEAGVHYIEVKGDVSNLKEQYDWVESHPNEAYEIAQRGQNVCLQSYTKENAQQVAINIIQTLPNASAEQMAEVDIILEEYFELLKRRNRTKDIYENRTP